MMHAIRCEDVQDRLEEFHDDELALEQRVAIQSHLRDCVTCSLMATEFEDLRTSLREAAFQLPDRDAPEAERLPRRVMERLRVEAQYSLGAEIKSLFQDMHLVWAALGATAAILFCLVGSISVLHAASQERPDSLAGLITFLANPGSNENPVRLDVHMLAPRYRADDDMGWLCHPMPADDAVLALSAVVTREGRVQNLELLEGDRPVARESAAGRAAGDAAGGITDGIRACEGHSHWRTGRGEHGVGPRQHHRQGPADRRCDPGAAPADQFACQSSACAARQARHARGDCAPGDGRLSLL